MISFPFSKDDKVVDVVDIGVDSDVGGDHDVGDDRDVGDGYF